MSYGRKVLGTVGRKIQVLIDGEFAQAKVGGVTLDWALIGAVGVPTNEVQRITITGGPTGGTFTLSGVNPLTGDAFTTAPIARNASAAVLIAALVAVIGAGNASGTGGALPGTAVDATFIGAWAAQNVAQMTADGSGLTGGSGPAVAVTTVTPGIPVYEPNERLIVQPGNKFLRYGQIICEVTAEVADKGYYGPYDPDATDGRQTLTPGKCFFLNETVVKDALPGVPFNPVESDVIGVWDAGRIYIERIIHSGAAAHSLALGPTQAEFLAAFPRVQPTWF